MPVMTKFEHGAQIACVSSLIGMLRSKNMKFEDCKIVIYKRVEQGDYQINYEYDSD